MSFQLSAPLNTAAIAISRISSSKCSRFRSTRGSRNSAKYFRGFSISPSHPAKRLPHIAIYMRRPCSLPSISGNCAWFASYYIDMNAKPAAALEPDHEEILEWIEAFDEVIDQEGPGQGTRLLDALTRRAQQSGVDVPVHLNTPYVNTIPVEEELPYPGDRTMERRIKSLIRWNAMAMVHRQNKKDPGIGGHISTYSSLATLLKLGYNHFFHATYGDEPGDFVYFQGHASPGVYARGYLEGRISQQQIENYRHELRDTPGLSSYPHPWLMPEYWRFPTVSMGIGPLSAIYQARFMRYLENRSIIPTTPRKVWAFVGDGESDEPESMGSLTLGAREKLDNLIFVVNCNLQRLDGPVR